MSSAEDRREKFRKTFLLGLTVAISILFILMIRGFLVALLLAAIFSAMAQPGYRWILKVVRGRAAAAAAITVTLVLLLIVGPLSAFIAVVVSQAVQVSQSVGPWVEQQVREPSELIALLERIPFAERLHVVDLVSRYQDQIFSKAGELAGSAGGFLVSRMAAASRITVTFVLNLFIMLYAMFFFLRGGRSILDKILYYVPLDSRDENRMVERFVSVTKATLKGTLLIGGIQGLLTGLAFWIAGINGPAFWGTVVAVLSIIPGIGGALIWIPAVIYLFVTGHALAAVLLAIWCLVVVGSIDNVLRPALVGRDAKLSDLLILLSTLGGLVLFGALGVIIGPIVAALFVTVWDIYGNAFRDLLPAVDGNG